MSLWTKLSVVCDLAMIVTETDIAALRDAIDRHASSWKWIANMHRAMARDGGLKDPKGVAKATFRGSPQEAGAAPSM